MLSMLGMQLPKEIMQVFIRWYAAYALSYRNLDIKQKGTLRCDYC